jgi:hypothetical protein
MLTLYAQYYVPSDRLRQREIHECFERNLSNPLVHQFVIFFENEEDQRLIPNYPKVIKKNWPQRLTYRKWLEETNSLPVGALSILINSDIYLTSSISHLIENQALIASQKRFIALSRYNPSEQDFSLNKNPHWTQDTWALVRSAEKLPSNLLQEAAFEIGHPGCDNKIAYVMQSYGYTLTNPCEKVRTVHLQKSDQRAYDAKLNKLLGLQAFVYPTDHVLNDSVVELDLLTRSKIQPSKIRVNNWINDGKSFHLNSDLNCEEAGAINRLSQSKSIDHKQDIAIKENPVLNDIYQQKNLIPRNHFILDAYKEEVIFSKQFKIFSDLTHYFIYDEYWPYVKKINKALWADEKFSHENVGLFIKAFVPTNLTMENVDISREMRYPEDILFWQYPCRTEGDAAHNHLSLKSGVLGRVVHSYLPMPWATFIDKKKFPVAYIGFLGRRIAAVKEYLYKFKFELHIHTVCQHIHFSRDLPKYIAELGITDLWTSHKIVGLDFLGKTRLHAWPLYAVNYREVERSKDLYYLPIEQKKIFASFIGAYMSHYMSDVRLKLNLLQPMRDFVIELNDEWHFNTVVYDYQVAGKATSNPIHRYDEIAHYNEVLSNSIFSLCPSGAGPNSLRLWESMAVGSIPVILSDQYELPSLDSIPGMNQAMWNDAVIIHPENDIETLEQRLRAIPMSRLSEMQSNCLNIYRAIESMTCF